MRISLDQVGKRFERHWIFQDINFQIESGERLVLLGPNGSGKSTLLQILSGSMSPSRGVCAFEHEGKTYEPSAVFAQMSISTPYMQVIEEYTLPEIYSFQKQFKDFLPGVTKDKFLELSGLSNHSKKMIKQFSSGMKQRVKLLLAILSDTSLLLLDEPTTNLDQRSSDWYLNLVEDFAKKRTVIVASNLPREYEFTKRSLNIESFQPETTH